MSKLYEDELKDFNNEIVAELKIELASRYNGTNGSIKERLATDEQFKVALKILQDNKSYSTLLNSTAKL